MKRGLMRRDVVGQKKDKYGENQREDKEEDEKTQEEMNDNLSPLGLNFSHPHNLPVLVV
jgi:hypothetical protein